MIGIVDDYLRDKRYGFIQPEGGGKRVFFHAQQLVKERFKGKLAKGDKLSFDIELGDRGPRAINIARV